MLQIVAIGLGAGAAAALLFASVRSGAILSILLFYLAPLPILIAVLGWSHVAGLVAAAAASLALAATFGWPLFFAFLAGVGLPAWWLGYLALLARPGNDGSYEWYPVGRLVVWSALLGALVVIVAIPVFGTDEASFNAALRAGFERLIRAESGVPAPGGSETAGGDASRLVDFLVLIIPPTAAVLATITNLINLWLAARAVAFSGRLRRPWPDIAAMQFPLGAAALLPAALVVSLVGGLVGIAATVLAASLMTAFGILGFAVLHAVTRGTSSRPFVLSGLYAATLLFGWPIVFMSLFGVAETLFGLRARIAQRRGPPAPF
ncbi:MAG TPA: DUF2232 domain-containing protein [Pseudolabrys sp.]|nr:DUF2232 domain-containing protein [Pseudolabrys sp.]